MVLILGLGVAVIVAIAVAVFVLRSSRSRDRDRGEEWGPDQEAPRSRRPRREPNDDEWSIDDYRSPHPIRGKYAAPSGGAPAGGGPSGASPSAAGSPGGAAGGGRRARRVEPPTRMDTPRVDPSRPQAARPDVARPDAGRPDPMRADTLRVDTPGRGYQPGGYQANGYGTNGYPPNGYEAGADQYDRAGFGGATGPNGQGGAEGYGRPAAREGYGREDSYADREDAYGRRAAREDRQQAPAGFPQAGIAQDGDDADSGSYDENDAAREDRRGGRRKAGGKRFSMRLSRRGDADDIWPDDEVSDEDYWASVATERSLPSTERRADAGAAGSAVSARAGDPRQGPPTDPRQALAAGGRNPRPAAGLALPSSGTVRFGARSDDQRGDPRTDPRSDPRGGQPPARQPEPRAYPDANGYPDPRELRPSARPPGRHGTPPGGDPLSSPAYADANSYTGARRAQVPPDRYEAALTEQTQTFTMSDGDSPQAPTAQYPARGQLGIGAGGQTGPGQQGGQPGGGRHSRPDDRARTPYPYEDPDSGDPYNSDYGRGRR